MYYSCNECTYCAISLVTVTAFVSLGLPVCACVQGAVQQCFVMVESLAICWPMCSPLSPLSTPFNVLYLRVLKQDTRRRPGLCKCAHRHWATDVTWKHVEITWRKKEAKEKSRTLILFSLFFYSRLGAYIWVCERWLETAARLILITPTFFVHRSCLLKTKK